MADLKSRLAAQELEIQKANSKFEFSVAEQEKLKKNFEAEKKIWADEKTSLVTRLRRQRHYLQKQQRSCPT